MWMQRTAAVCPLLVALAVVSRADRSLLSGTERLTPSSDQVTISGADIKIQPGKEDYPGVNVAAASGKWDLSSFGHIEARIANTGTQALNISLRVDNEGDWRDSPWNAESLSIPAGQTATLKTIFGYSYGLRPGYKLKPNAVSHILLFVSKSDAPQSFRIESLSAAGPAGEKPPVAPDDVRTKPKEGILLGTGAPLKAVFADAAGTTSLRPPQGRWDLRDFDEVRVKIRNDGASPIRPRIRIESNGGASEWVSSAHPLPAGASSEVIVPFEGAQPFDLGAQAGGSKLASDAVSAIVFGSASAGTFAVERVQATSSPATIPAWLGKRPPVTGDWVKTLDEGFDGVTLNAKIWNVKGENYYDKVSHWSKENLIVGGGMARLRYAKKRGHHNDDPARPESPYASGFLDTYGKWTQRYGYFEARTKLPDAPGLWPAFWMMPDRGAATGEQWKRQDTANGGMEFDVMEHLTRWGGRRYNISMHYDGYDKDHKSVGSDKVYVRPDKDGFITCGLLWTPGLAVYYCNGREVLRWKNPRISSVPSILMFTLPSGGWDNNSIDDDRLPADFVIDYVRVWQRRDLAK